jgi:hypothetical protein
MSRFPAAGHLVSWAGLCPGQIESAGKRKSSLLRKGAPWLKTMLVQCAWAASRKKDSCEAQFRRLRAKRGPKKAVGAVAAAVLTAIFPMLKDGTPHPDLGPGHFDSRSTQTNDQAPHRSMRKAGVPGPTPAPRGGSMLPSVPAIPALPGANHHLVSC